MIASNIPALRVGERINYEYAPGREASPKVLDIVENEDGTYNLTLERFGTIHGWTALDVVLVVG